MVYFFTAVGWLAALFAGVAFYSTFSGKVGSDIQLNLQSVLDTV